MNWLFLHALFSGLVSLLLATAFLVLAQEERLRHCRHWAGSYLLLFLAMLALGVVASRQDASAAAVLAAAVFGLSGLLSAYAGLREWRGLDPKGATLGTVAAGYCMGAALLVLFPPLFALLVPATALLGGTLCSALAVWALARTGTASNAGQQLAIAFWLVIALALVVSLLALLWPIPEGAVRHPAPPLASGVAAYALVFAFPLAFLGAGVLQLVAMLLERGADLREANIRDAVTGLHNRHGFTELAAQMYSAAQRGRQSLSLLICDIDNFKILNSTFGAEAGDRALMSFAAALTDNTRHSDLVARFGGESFVLLMPGTGHEAARVVCERIRRQLQEAEVVAPDGERFALTASFGLTERDGEEDSLDAMLKRADFALYKSKADGRNRVTAVTAVDTSL